MKSFIIALLFISCVFCELKEENGIYVLTDNNFQSTIKEHDSMFIEFYSSVFCFESDWFVETTWLFEICFYSGNHCSEVEW